MIESFDEFVLFDGVAPDPADPVDFWYPVAVRAVKHFPTKAEFMRFINERFAGDQNRMAASCCWDIVRLKESE